MEVLTLLIALVALVLAVMALQRTGGMQDLRRQLEDVTKKSEEATKSAREAAADALGRLEGFIRGGNKEASEASKGEEGTGEESKSSEEHKP